MSEWNYEDPLMDGIYLCWQDSPPQSFKVQGVRRKDGRWLTSWPVVAWQDYPDPPSKPKINQKEENNEA